MSDRKGIAVYCRACKMRKKPIGRSAGLDMAGSLCDSDCEGYYSKPIPGSLWPGELASKFGFSVGDAGTEVVGTRSLEDNFVDHAHDSTKIHRENLREDEEAGDEYAERHTRCAGRSKRDSEPQTPDSRRRDPPPARRERVAEGPHLRLLWFVWA